MFRFPEHVFEKGRVVIGWWKLGKSALGGLQVHAGVVRELDSLNDIENDGVFETAVVKEVSSGIIVKGRVR